jgi:hypothetical protein
MSLEQLFYALGSALIISWLVILVVAVIVLIWLARRFKNFQRNLKKSSIATAGMKLMQPNALKTLLAILPMLKVGMGLIKSAKSKKRS